MARVQRKVFPQWALQGEGNISMTAPALNKAGGATLTAIGLEPGYPMAPNDPPLGLKCPLRLERALKHTQWIQWIQWGVEDDG